MRERRRILRWWKNQNREVEEIASVFVQRFDAPVFNNKPCDMENLDLAFQQSLHVIT